MIDAIYDNSDIAFDDVIHIEASWFVSTLMNPSRNTAVDTLLVHKTALGKGAARPLNTKDMSVKKLGVMGAGMMGAGIAFVSARVGIEVVLLLTLQLVLLLHLLNVLEHLLLRLLLLRHHLMLILRQLVLLLLVIKPLLIKGWQLFKAYLIRVSNVKK